MLKKFTLLLPTDIFNELKVEASQQKISVSDVIRKKIFQSKNPRPANNPRSHSANVEESRSPAAAISVPPAAENQIPNTYFLSLETLYLLREFLFERNAQILKRVDDKMEKRFGKERKKIP